MESLNMLENLLCQSDTPCRGEVCPPRRSKVEQFFIDQSFQQLRDAYATNSRDEVAFGHEIAVEAPSCSLESGLPPMARVLVARLPDLTIRVAERRLYRHAQRGPAADPVTNYRGTFGPLQRRRGDIQTVA